MKMKTILISLLTLFFIYGNSSVHAQADAITILKKMDDVIFAIKDKTVVVKMVMLNMKTQKEKVKEAALIQKGPAMKLFRYTAPSSDAGITTLTLPNKEIYLYLPMFKKPKKITNLAESGAVNKSDFSIEEMATQQYSEVYVPKLIASEGATFKLDLRPMDESQSVRRIVVYVNKENYYPEQFDFYNKKGQVYKTSMYHHINLSWYWVADVVSMQDLKKNHKTTLYMSDIKINQGLKDDLFTVENMVPTDLDE